MEVGFGFHSSKKWQLARALFASVFVFFALSVVIFSEGKPVAETFEGHPAWFLAFGLFFIFSLILMIQLLHATRSEFVLSFGEDGLIDRRRLKPRFIPYSSIEIFSPDPEKIFRVDPAIAEVRAKVGIEDFVTISCRLKRDSEAGAVADFVFFERVATPQYEMQQLIVARLREKIAKFDLLIYDDGEGFGDDETTS